MRILVTGGAGFIGSHLVDALVDEGHEVTVVDDLSTGSADNVNPRARFQRLDLRSPDLAALVAAVDPDVISHQAAQVSVTRSVEDPLHDARVNVLGSINLLEAARRHGVRRVVFASTGGAIYGETATIADERHPCRPQSPYAVAKLAVEHYLEYYRATWGLDPVVLRYANVYGPRQDPHGEAGVVAIFIQRILAVQAPTIYGDGEQVRDFVYVDDVVQAGRAALRLPPAAETRVFNVSTGRATSVNALWRSLAAITSAQMVPEHAPPRPGDLLRSVLDPGRAARDLGWRPAVDLSAGLRRTWEWFRARCPTP